MKIIESDLKKLKDDMRNMSENKIKNRGLDVLVKFIEEVFFGEDILPDYVDMSKAIPIRRTKQIKRVEKILKDSKKKKTRRGT